MRNDVVLPGDGTQVDESSFHALSLGDMSQILHHTKGECRSRRCIIELSFDNQQTFEDFLGTVPHLQPLKVICRCMQLTCTFIFQRDMMTIYFIVTQNRMAFARSDQH